MPDGGALLFLDKVLSCISLLERLHSLSSAQLLIALDMYEHIVPRQV